jgi:hypothetical protein
MASKSFVALVSLATLGGANAATQLVERAGADAEYAANPIRKVVNMMQLGSLRIQDLVNNLLGLHMNSCACVYTIDLY